MTNLQKANLKASLELLKRVKSANDKFEVFFAKTHIRTAFVDFKKDVNPTITSVMMWLDNAMKYGSNMESSMLSCVKDALRLLETLETNR